DIDANGIVKVTAKDKATGKSQQITISGSTALSDDEVDRMVKDAESHAEEDRAKKDEIEVRNQTDSLAYSTEQTVKDLGDKLTDELKQQANDAVEAAKTALAGSDIDAVKAAGERLQEVGHELAKVVYSTTDENAAAGMGVDPNMGTPSADDDVVDADYEVVDDDE
ncbi:MAG: Hsp70 family protein, partial [Atopobiaceae bacterium]|nr:Hsp70 family protein [Atopobiaceae bacterium]